MKIVRREQIESVLPSLKLVPPLEAAFDAYSAGRAVISTPKTALPTHSTGLSQSFRKKASISSPNGIP